jgi:hypothetical protein
MGKVIRTFQREFLIAGFVPEPVSGKAFVNHWTIDQMGAIVGLVVAFCNPSGHWNRVSLSSFAYTWWHGGNNFGFVCQGGCNKKKTKVNVNIGPSIRHIFITPG